MRSSSVWSTVLAVLLASGGGGALAQDAITLVEDGASAYQIVLRGEAPTVEVSAAELLQAYVAESTGVTLPIVSEPERAAGMPAVHVGRGPALQQAFPELDLAPLEADGIVLKTQGADIYLGGGASRGTIYAVQEFLEEVVGVRWWTSTEKYVPQRERIDVPALDTVYTPFLRYREEWYLDTFDPTFAMRLRLNGYHHPIPEDWGGHYSILGWCHTFYPLLPPEDYFDAHPEWYSEINGVRTHDRAQLCLTNDEMRAELTKNALEWLREAPDAGYISISQNDWYGRCECADCLAVEEIEGTPSGPLLHFVNAVAEDIEQEFPDTLVETLAYQYTREAPKHVKPRHNVLVRLCSIECSFAEPLTAEVNADFRRDMEAWREISPQLFVWDYVANFPSYIMPHPNWFVLADNVHFFVDHNVRGLFEQGDGGSTVGDFVAMRAWVLAKLMWDPSRDLEALYREFLTGYYGPAAAPLRAYMDVMHEAVRRDDSFLGCFMHHTGDWLTLNDMNRATELMDQALEAVADYSDLTDRVIKARMSLDHVWLLRYHALEREARLADKPFLGPDDPIAAAEAFVANAQRFNNPQYRERMSFEHYAPQLLARFREPGEPPQAAQGLPAEDWYVISDALFSQHGPGRLVFQEDDPVASDGKSARMPGDHNEWALQYVIGQDLADMGPVHCYVDLRAEGIPDDTGDQPALHVGIYDTRDGASVMQFPVMLDQIADETFTTVDLGVQELAAGMYFWLAPAGGAEQVYLDRLYLIKAEE